MQPLLACTAQRRPRHDPQPGHDVGSIAHADAAAEMTAVLALPGGSVTVASTPAAATVAGGRPVRRAAGDPVHDEIARRRFLPRPGAGGGHRLRRDRPPARRLRPLRGRRRGRRRRRRGRLGARGYLSVGLVPDGGRPHRGGRRHASTARWRPPASWPQRARPGRRHPRHRRLPRPAGRRADRARPADGGRRGEPEDRHERRAATTSGCRQRRSTDDRAGAPAAVRRAAPRPRPDRHPRRLRARRLRRVHGARRRRSRSAPA